VSADRLAIFSVVTDRHYSFARSKIASIALRDAQVVATNKIMRRTSRRGIFIVRSNDPGLAAVRSASVRTPINAGKTVAARTRQFSIACEYAIPDSRPASAFSSHV
jgi:hypothetical protein